MYALLRGRALLTAEQRDLVVGRAKHTLCAVALHERERVNWLPHVGAPRKGRDKILVQWCHGAPGMIVGLGQLPNDPDVDALFAAAGETIWAAGPLVKGSGLCHGTAGNGWAFLVLYARTQDSRWLDRARRFAMHAIHQVRVARGDAHRGRYSLWTGDLGVALFVQACRDLDLASWSAPT
jgi:lantibiotic modifying enzyme